MAKVRVHELAKEFGVPSKTVLETLKDMGEFVKTASSTVEAPVVRRLNEQYGETLCEQGAKKKAAKKAPAKKADKAKTEAATTSADITTRARFSERRLSRAGERSTAVTWAPAAPSCRVLPPFTKVSGFTCEPVIPSRGTVWLCVPSGLPGWSPSCVNCVSR